MAQPIKFTSPPVATVGLPEQYYIFKAETSPSGSYSDIGGQVKDAAEANPSGLDCLGPIQTPGLILKTNHLKNLWLILKDSSNTASSTYAIVMDLEEELELIDPDKLGVMGSLINADVSIKLKRIVYSHNLAPDLEGLSRDNILQESPQLYWPETFEAGLYGEFALCIGEEETSFRLKYAVYQYDKYGNVVPNPDDEENEDENTEEEGGGTPGENNEDETPGEDTNAENKGKSETKNISPQERTPVFSLDELLVTFKGEGLSISIDASIALGPLTGKLINFDVEIDFTEMSIHPSLRGVGIGFDEPPISIAGALLKNEDEYDGGLAIGLTEWSMVALGSIAMVDIAGTSIPSVFLYGYLGGELVNIEGIAAITGLAATLGFNRELTTPTDISKLPDHPLIKAAESSPTNPIKLDDLVKILKELKTYVPPKAGSFFFGLGMKGSVVELISLYALPVVTLEFNLDQFPPTPENAKIQLFGLGSVALPQESAVVELELAIAGSFSVKDQEILIGGALTENSGIKIVPELKLKLSGGFAFYFKPNVGEGDPSFVFTIGGYGRMLTPQPEWPIVDPITLKWSPTDDIDISAKFNFAVTPKCLTVGFDVDGSAEYGGKAFSAGASFSIGIGFLIQWAPFLYKGEAHADFHAYVKAWALVTSAQKSFDLQAKAEIWGGEGQKFSGSAELHVNLLFPINLSVDWGDDETEPQPISWDRFKSSFLPPADANNQLKLSGIKIKKGVSGTLQGKDEKQYAIVEHGPLEISIDGFLPSTKITYNGNDLDLNGNETSLGIQTMGYTHELFQANIAPALNVSIKKDGNEIPFSVEVGSQAEGDKNKLSRRAKAASRGQVEEDENKPPLGISVVNADVHASLWKPAAQMYEVADIDPNSAYQIREVPKGVAIKSQEPEAGSEFDIDKSELEFDVTNGGRLESQKIEQLPVGTRQTEGSVVSDMINHPPDRDLLAALGITEAPAFAKLKETDLEAAPYLV